MQWLGAGMGLALVALGTTFSIQGARADEQDDFKSLMADCNRADLDSSDIHDCMERASVLDEARPSPALQRLLTELELKAEDSEGSDQSKPADAATSPAQATTAPRPLAGAEPQASRTHALPQSAPPASEASDTSASTAPRSLAASAGGASSAADSSQSPSMLGATWNALSHLADHLVPDTRDPSADPAPREVDAQDEAPAAEHEGASVDTPQEPSHN